MIYKFIDDNGSFTVKNAQNISYLYFPLTNAGGTLLSSISPNLGGDIKQDNDHFLTPPACIEDIKSNPLSRREFFLKLTSHKNKIIRTSEPDNSVLEAGILYHKVRYRYPEVSLTVVSFIPYDLDVEVTHITVESNRDIEFIPTFFLPLYGRGENNLRNHRHVSSLLNRVHLDKYGIILKPTMSFNEKAHTVNKTIYFVLGYSENKKPPIGQFPTLLDFCGEKGNLRYPQAVYENRQPSNKNNPVFDGKESCAALQFRKRRLRRKNTAQYSFIAGIAKDKNYPKNTFSKLNSFDKIHLYFDKTKNYWHNTAAFLKNTSQQNKQQSSKISPVEDQNKFNISSDNRNYNGWLKWVLFQPVLRKIFGCSFLPHFDYGKGGRGWRDLWQDALSLILIDIKDTEKLIIDNFKGVRIDGSNATIVTQNGNFIPDRNKIFRVWSDHGAWPYFTLREYMNQSGNIDILLKETTYFHDHQLKRAKETDNEYSGKNNLLKTRNGKVYKGSILEHLLIENLVQFFNVGKHNITRLENADWNDGLDMAYDKGESVSFSCVYADNLENISYFLDELHKKKEKVKLLEELTPLLDTISRRINYSSPKEKINLLDNYLDKTKKYVSGRKKEVNLLLIAKDLRHKSKWLKGFIRKKEWIKTPGFFNGYYDNAGKRVEGNKGASTRLMLASQVFAIMSGVASLKQIDKIWLSIKKYLWDKRLKGFRLNTDFKSLYLDFGRAFGFSYGDKENGAFFNHMTIMLSYALYQRNFSNEANEVFTSVYNMAVSRKSKIYPMIPEYFNNEGRGLYFYLTGSASWYIHTLIHQVLGIKYNLGNLIIQPRINSKKPLGNISVDLTVRKRHLKINYFIKTQRKPKTTKGFINNTKIVQEDNKLIIPLSEIARLPKNKQHTIEITLT